MIIPHPESDLRLNIMVLGAEIIELLKPTIKSNDYILVEKVLSAFLKNDERRTPDLFIHILVFLYSVGLIDHKGYKIKLTPHLTEPLNLFS
ncbi:hypothetical protein [Pedobacter antarcticus]|uniref:hypothetical protein n=1 Tax=Pedobacter antarcticus TaxID=34086 RepID=UPI000889D842|nr:hypothetical protein [Pedobacter antarcticus]SDL47198.1 hypothetical protein SAMN04488084_101404 [Pedobacter antarcticus]